MNAIACAKWWNDATPDERRDFLDGIGGMAHRVNRLTYNVFPGVSEKETAAMGSQLVPQGQTPTQGEKDADSSSRGKGGRSGHEGSHGSRG